MVPARFEIGQKHKQNTEASSRASWNTPRSDTRSGISYTTRVAASFALASIMTVAVLVGVVAVVWSGVFSDYTRTNMTEIAQSTAQRLADAYESEGEWSTTLLASIADTTLTSDDVGMQVVDAEGTILYDDSWPAAAALEASQGSNGAASHSLVSSAPTDAAASVTRDITLSDGTMVGQVRMWVFGSDALLSKADTAFRDRTFNAMFLASIIAVVIAIIIGIFVSRMLTNPLRRITGTAKQIRDGDLSARTGLRGDDEIDRLGETFDEMATSLEKDLKHERRITSDVAHELRTPLMAMLATVEAMQDGVLPADDEHLETVASETRRLSRLVQQMLELSRMENRTEPLNLQEFELVPFVRKIVDSQRQLFRSHEIVLTFSDNMQNRSSAIEADADMITQAVVNIMSNAMRYTPEGGSVEVSVHADRRYLMVSVADTGIGIAKEDLSRIFGRFWRADASRAREAGGLGVGLSVTKQIVERHHGYISVESELGKGTTFTIHLPREHTAELPSSTMEH